jgi:hypothetical protein
MTVSATSRFGGNPGGGGGFTRFTFDPSILAATETVTVGAGGAGAASQTVNDTDGIQGSPGGNTSFGLFISGQGGLGGLGGGLAATPVQAAAGGIGSDGGFAPDSGSATVACVRAAASLYGGGAGGGGGKAQSGVTLRAAAAGALKATGYPGTLASGLAAVGDGTDGGDGVSPAALIAPGTGGGGGAGSLVAGAGLGVGGDGGDGGRASGGGGGGPSINGTVGSGLGGNGGNGIACIITEF